MLLLFLPFNTIFETLLSNLPTESGAMIMKPLTILCIKKIEQKSNFLEICKNF